MAHGYTRNKQLVDLSQTPQEIKDQIVFEYNAQKDKGRSEMFNYFLQYKLNGMMDVIQEF